MMFLLSVESSMYRTVCKIFLVLSVSPINQVAEILSVVAQLLPYLLVGMAHEAPPFLQIESVKGTPSVL